MIVYLKKSNDDYKVTTAKKLEEQFTKFKTTNYDLIEKMKILSEENQKLQNMKKPKIIEKLAPVVKEVKVTPKAVIPLKLVESKDA